MTEPAVRSDSGFMLLDAVLAVGLLSFAGTVVIMIANTMLGQQERELDRSVALVASQSLIKQYLLVGPVSGSRLEREDELFVYRFEQGAGRASGTTALVEMALLARPKSGREVDAVQLDFLAPASAP